MAGTELRPRRARLGLIEARMQTHCDDAAVRAPHPRRARLGLIEALIHDDRAPQNSPRLHPRRARLGLIEARESNPHFATPTYAAIASEARAPRPH